MRDLSKTGPLRRNLQGNDVKDICFSITVIEAAASISKSWVCINFDKKWIPRYIYPRKIQLRVQIWCDALSSTYQYAPNWHLLHIVSIFRMLENISYRHLHVWNNALHEMNSVLKHN